MRHALLRLTGLLIVLTLVLAGCNLIGVDEMKKLDLDFAALEKQYSGVVATYGDGETITQKDVMGSFNSQYSYMSQMYAMYGMSLSNDVVEDIKKTVVEDAVQNIAIARQLESRGLPLDADKQAEVDAEAKEHYQEAYDAVYASAEGKTEELKAKQAEYNLYVMGYTEDAIKAMEQSSANYERIEEAVRDEITEVSDDELKAYYDEQVKSDEETYADNASAFESAMSSEGSVVCWMPEGYRTVKHILVKPEDDVLSAVTDARSAVKSAESALEDLQGELDALKDADAKDAETADAKAEDAETEDAEAEDAEAEPAAQPRTEQEIKADITTAEENLKSLKADAEKAEADCLASVQDKLDEIYKKIEDGEDFEALIEAYGEDPGMQNEPTKTRGYYVSSKSVVWDSHFTEGAMALEKVGDISKTPVISASGVHIIRYESDVTPGAVALEDIHDALYDEKLDDMKTEHFNSELDAWVEALKPVYTLENFDLTTPAE